MTRTPGPARAQVGPDRPRLAPGTAAIASLCATAADLAFLTLLASQLAGPGALAPAPAAAAALASLTRLTLAGRAARRQGHARLMSTGRRTTVWRPRLAPGGPGHAQPGAFLRYRHTTPAMKEIADGR